MSDQSSYLTFPKLCKHLSLSRPTIYKLISQGMPVKKLPSGIHLFKLSEVDNWLNQINQLRRPNEREN